MADSEQLRALMEKLESYSRPSTGSAWSQTVEKILGLLVSESPGGAATREDAGVESGAASQGPRHHSPRGDSLLPEGAEEFVSEGMPALRFVDLCGHRCELRAAPARRFEPRWPDDPRMSEFGHAYYVPDFAGYGSWLPETVERWIRHQWSLLESNPPIKPDPEPTEDEEGDALEMFENALSPALWGRTEAPSPVLQRMLAAIDALRAERAQTQGEVARGLERIAELEKEHDRERQAHLDATANSADLCRILSRVEDERDTYRAKFEGLRGAVERWRARSDAFRATMTEVINAARNHDAAFVDDSTAREEVAAENVRALDAILDRYPLDGSAPESGLVWREAPDALLAPGTYWLEEHTGVRYVRTYNEPVVKTSRVVRIAGPIDVPEPREPEDAKGEG